MPTAPLLSLSLSLSLAPGVMLPYDSTASLQKKITSLAHVTINNAIVVLAGTLSFSPA